MGMASSSRIKPKATSVDGHGGMRAVDSTLAFDHSVTNLVADFSATLTQHEEFYTCFTSLASPIHTGFSLLCLCVCATCPV
jgi:hypothetical protein